VCCSVLQCVAVCCSVLQCVAVCCSVLQCIAVSRRYKNTHSIFWCKTVDPAVVVMANHFCMLQRVAACYSVLQRVAACCSVLQCVAVCCVCCSVLHCVAMFGRYIHTFPIFWSEIVGSFLVHHIC